MRNVALLSLVSTAGLVLASQAWALEVSGDASAEPRKQFTSAGAPGESSFSTAMMSKARDGETIMSQGGGATPDLPLTIMETNGIRFITGGIGEEEEAQLKSVSRDFNTQVLVTGQQGEYLSGAMVRVLNEQGAEVLATDGAGPYFFTQLPPGNYTVEVTAQQGGIKKSALHVPQTGTAKEHFRFTV
jgi:hypothetical protein